MVNRFSSFLVSAAVAGALAILPLAILFLAAMEIYGLLKETATLAQLELPFPSFINAIIYLTVVFGLFFFGCVAIGLAIRSRFGKRVAEVIEKSIVERIPLLGFVRNLTMNIVGGPDSKARIVEVDLHGSGTSMLGILIETLPDTRQVIFVPSAPAVTLGNVYIVHAHQVRLTDSTVTSFANVITQWGLGTTDLLEARSREQEP